jgi:mannose-6-phosphate isomerase-like protein (cupin superfamily)
MSRATLVVLALVIPTALIAQTPPAQAPPPRVVRPTAPRAAVGNVTFHVTNSLGAPLADVAVSTQTPVAREGTTAGDGSVRFTNLRPGTYRVRFERDGSITLERDVPIAAGDFTVDVSLNASKAPAKTPEPAKPTVTEQPSKTLPPAGAPRITAVPLFLEKNFINRDPRKDSPLGCAPTGTATLHQLREAWLNHAHDDADEWVYVVAGEGTLRLGTAEQRMAAGTFASIPHTVSHALLPTGRNPLIVISVLSGPACNTGP